MRLLMGPLILAGSLAAADATYDGSRVHYESYGKGKDALVFIHGWTCDLTFWRGQAPVYQKHRSLLVDLPGHGRSEKPDVSYTRERFARAIAAVMSDAGVERAVLVGHSMGGPIATTFLQLFPARTKALVMVDAFVPTAADKDAERSGRQAEAYARSFREPGYKEMARKMIERMFSDKTTPSQRDEIRSKMLATPQHVMASAMEDIFTLETPKPGKTYTLPVMAIMSARPGQPGYDARLRTLFPNLKYEEWQGSGHFLMIESPDRFNRALEQFLADVGNSKK
jgi:pimeloyl-ACP methyl ester carboxylesterase